MTRNADSDLAQSKIPSAEPVPENLSDIEEEAILKKKAVRMHQVRAIRMVLVAAALAAMFVFLHGFFRALATHKELSHFHLEFAPPLVLFGCVVWFSVRYAIFSYRWRMAVSNAGNLGKTLIMIEGFTEVFRIYAKTRRSGLYASFWIVWGIYLLYFSIRYYSRLPNSETWPIAISAAMMFFLTISYYLLSRKFLPGETFIEYVISLNERAATAQQTNSENSLQVDKHLRPYKRAKYWWFY